MKNSVSVRHDERSLEIPSHELAGHPCSQCDCELDLHQPNPATPERLLATCNDCGAWYLVDLQPDDAMARVTHLTPPAAREPHFSRMRKARVDRSHSAGRG